MHQPEQPVLRDIVLVGGGHSHVGVLKRFAMNPMPGVRITLICRDTHTPYSGMLPGYVAGHYGYDEVHIDLRRLAEYAGARFLRDEALGIDRRAQQVVCRSRPPVPYDRLSINIGSTPKIDDVAGASEHTVPVKPIHRFNGHWQALLDRIKHHSGPTRIAVVGGGAGGVELLLAMQHRLCNELGIQQGSSDDLQFHLFTRSAEILPTHNVHVRKHFARTLARRGVTLHTATDVSRVESDHLYSAAGERFDADEIVWVTRAGGAAWLESTGLALDDNGFIQVRDTLQTVSDPLIFAAGDIAAMVDHPREKAGVFAVRQGRPLARNLRASITGRPLKPYRPQRQWLALISTGDRYAVASRGRLDFHGAWVWRWKDWIDRRFMARFNDHPPMEHAGANIAHPSLPLNDEEAAQAISALAMRCGGCGAKVGASVLSRALGALKPVERDDVLVGLHDPDDAAVVRVPPGKAMVHTVDFFRAFIDDPYIFGKVAANHALGDIFAMGAEAQTATAVATVPQGLEAKVEDVVFQMMAGALEVLNEAHCALVGGHTGEGQELALGFAINGLVDEDAAIMRKGGMRPGEALILTKPLGTGTLFAAHARLAAHGRWIDAALDSMCQSNHRGAECLKAFGASACTDVTGFGLLGHLVEMTRPSGVDVEVDLAALPILDGAEETVAAGILSSLQPANVRLRRALRNQQAMIDHPRYALLFDPQTAGGLLASIPFDRAEACLAVLRERGYPHAAIIGGVREQSEALEPILLRG